MSRFTACIAAAALALPLPAAAQSADAYPSRPVKMIIPYAPGGATDIIARIVGIQLAKSLGQSFVVENHPGATGNIALEMVAKAPADGYTLLVGNVSTNTINENTFANTLTIKPSRDLVGVTKLVEIPHIVAASAAFPASSIPELIAAAKKAPGKINYGSAGIGSYPHLDMEKFERKAGMQLTHVPYKDGAGKMVPALLGNEIQVAFINLSSTLPHVRAGRIKALATTAPQRLPSFRTCRRWPSWAMRGSAPTRGRACSRPRRRPRPSSTSCATRSRPRFPDRP